MNMSALRFRLGARSPDVLYCWEKGDPAHQQQWAHNIHSNKKSVALVRVRYGGSLCLTSGQIREELVPGM